MCPDPLQFLTYMAAKTKKAMLGSMVVVLPWHDPMRVAEQVALLDNLSDGRMILGLGLFSGLKDKIIIIIMVNFFFRRANID